MPKAVFFNVPAHGHFNPSLPLVSELVNRGHQIAYFMTASYRPMIEATGAKFHIYDENVIQDNFFEGLGLNGTRPQLTARALAMASEALLPRLLHQTRQERPQYIIYDTMCPWGYMIGKILQIPTVGALSLMPMLPPSLPLLPKPTFWKLIGAIMPYLLRDFSANADTTRILRGIADKYRLQQPLKTIEMVNADADILISQLPPEFPFFVEHISKKVRFVGRDEPLQATIPLPDVIRNITDKKLIYISLGTVANQWREFFEMAIEAFRDSDYQIVISTGKGIKAETFGTLPPHIHLYDWVPQNEVLKRASLFITHSGLNSVIDGFFAGVPLLLVPQQTEQYINALRAVDLGAGVMLKKPQVSADALRTQAQQLLGDGRYAAASKQMGDAFRAAGGVSRAVDEIEALFGLA